MTPTRKLKKDEKVEFVLSDNPNFEKVVFKGKVACDPGHFKMWVTANRKNNRFMKKQDFCVYRSLVTVLK